MPGEVLDRLVESAFGVYLLWVEVGGVVAGLIDGPGVALTLIPLLLLRTLVLRGVDVLRRRRAGE